MGKRVELSMDMVVSVQHAKAMRGSSRSLGQEKGSPIAGLQAK